MKYKPLQEHLEMINQNIFQFSISFAEIETILGFNLPKSAYTYHAWWSNPKLPQKHTQAKSWLDAGWKVESVKLQEKWVKFSRNNPNSINDNKVNHQDSQQTIINDQNIFSHQQSESYHLILSLGFEEVGKWFIDGESLQFQLNKYKNERNFVYTFVDRGEIKYIGKSKKSLNNRMNGYKNPGPRQFTNIRNHEKMLEQLKNVELIQIFALFPKEEILYKGFPINIAAGLEDNLILRINPPWNKLI